MNCINKRSERCRSAPQNAARTTWRSSRMNLVLGGAHPLTPASRRRGLRVTAVSLKPDRG
ncbi:MAG: hypothetical protein M5U34_28645 [Chloroflexi bacterium]|nr:hypothetical protein [Chloroflexota bacterium]